MIWLVHCSLSCTKLSCCIPCTNLSLVANLGAKTKGNLPCQLIPFGILSHTPLHPVPNSLLKASRFLSPAFPCA